MVADDPVEYSVVLTPQFIDDLESCVSYVGEVLASPLAAKKMYEAIRDKVMGLSALPKVASSYISPTTGNTRYRISYNRYDIHYSVDDNELIVRVLGIKHQLQGKGWVD